MRWGLRSPTANSSSRTALLLIDVKGLSLGMRYRPLGLTVLVSVCSVRSGTIRKTLPPSVSSRCGVMRVAALLCSPAPPSPMETYMTRQSGSPGSASGLKIKSPIGWIWPDMSNRNSSRAVPSNVLLSMFVSVHWIRTVCRAPRWES